MKRGLIIGKFMPLHRGHCFLIDMALAMCDELCICLCSRASEVISGEFRRQCLQTQYPQAIVYHITKEIEYAHAANPLAPKIWSEEIKKEINNIAIDYVFASENYGRAFADYLGAEFVMVDPNRLAVPVSGEIVRANLYQHWDYLASSVKTHLVKIVGISGNEELIYKFVEQLGALYCKPYSQIVLNSSRIQPNETQDPSINTCLHIETVAQQQCVEFAMSSEQFALAVKAEIAALKKLEYPLVIWHYEQSNEDIHSSEVSVVNIDYERSLLDNFFEIQSKEDLANALAWWNTVEQESKLDL